MPLRVALRPSILASLALHGGLVVGACGWGSPSPEGSSTEVSARFAYDLPPAEEAPIDLPRPPDAPPDLPLPAAEVVVEAVPEPAPDDLPAAEPSLRSQAPSLERLPAGLRVSRAGPPASPTPALPAAARVSPVARGGVTRPSRPAASNARPVYPTTAVAAGLEGTVWLLVTVREDGGIGEVGVERTSGHGVLDDAALAAVRSWRYEPALTNGEPVPERLLIPVRFVLHGV